MTTYNADPIESAYTMGIYASIFGGIGFVFTPYWGISCVLGGLTVLFQLLLERRVEQVRAERPKVDAEIYSTLTVGTESD